MPAGLGALRWFFERLAPTLVQMRAYLEDGSPVPDPLPAAVAGRLKFKPVTLFEKRALWKESCEAVGLRANPRSNEKLLLEMEDLFDWDERLASGLWQEAKGDRPRRPNPQFYGWGQIGKAQERAQ